MFSKLPSITKHAILWLFFTIICIAVNAQPAKQNAAEKCKEALKLEEDYDFEGALKLLGEAEKFDPQSTAYPYETAYIWYAQKQYQQVIDKLEKLKDKPDSFDRLYQLLGKSYDVLDQRDKAIGIYEEGLKKFPKSGCLHLERGITLVDDAKYDAALTYFEKGIELQPSFADNYYWASKLYCNSTESLWGIMYGELFMNLERNGARNIEISKLLYDTYKSQLTVLLPGKVAVGFSKQAVTDLGKPGKLPYSMVYLPVMGIASASEASININSLDTVRTIFLKVYFDKGFNVKYPNALFDYQQKIAKADCMEAYNHWLLSQGDLPGFKIWKAQNPAKWQDFTTWYTANPIKLDDNNRFYKAAY